MSAIKAATPVRLSELPLQTIFEFPTSKRQRTKPKANLIRYFKPVEQIELVKQLMGVATPKEVGEATFDYYLAMEGDGNGR